MVLFHVDDFDSPACAKPQHLELVDEAFTRPGGPAGRLMREMLCSNCQAFSQCLSEAMQRGEWGMWGGTTTTSRTRHGAPKPSVVRRYVA